MVKKKNDKGISSSEIETKEIEDVKKELVSAEEIEDMEKFSPRKDESKKVMTKKKKEDSKRVSAEKTITKEKVVSKNVPDTMKIVGERDIASDFATKVYDKFDQIIKSIVLFGSSAKREATLVSDIDVIVIIDDVSVKWDEELISWYREELGKLIQYNPYVKPLHVNTVKLSTWWEDMIRGDPVVINILRHGDPLIDFGGFFGPLKLLLANGKIRSTPESIYTLLQRAPAHMTRAKQSMLAVVDGLYWTMVDAAHAALIAAGVMPASPEEIPKTLEENFVVNKQLNKRFIMYYDEIHRVAKDIIHGNRGSVKGRELDDWFLKTDAFLGEMARLVDVLIEKRAQEKK